MYVPYSVLKTIHEETHSAFPNAPVIPRAPRRPRRHPIRAVRGLLRRPAVQPGPTLALVSGADHELCEAEIRDRGTKVASATRAC